MCFRKITLYILTAIFLSTLFAQQVWARLTSVFSQKEIEFFGYGIFLLFILIFLVRKIKEGHKSFKIFYVTVIILISTLLSLKIELFSERVHLLEFGVLGWFVIKDFTNNSFSQVKNIVFSTLFILLISSIDELFQWFLPWRVGEFNDILFNSCGGFLGVWIYSVSNLS